MKNIKGKTRNNISGNPKVSGDVSAETLQPRREWQDIFKVMKGGNLQPKLLYLQGSHSYSKGKSKASQISEN